eukprot:gnl/TRDRNA2_/TRDRNA2_58789_c0_seq1.p1 gnl/TRDRNA2_/TRDRNA2_58789_c0~~gnl/TRDRNA2_/TRDRNA2_58789_c0_seq1.p1  ORF type:complete len:181 (-),score=43.07 gnl/TRDRNA2_/TRDRNA2_58789_c0_seq1:278-820(-)
MAGEVKCQVHADAVVCTDAKVLGSFGVKIGEGTVVHPACHIHAKAGPIEIGRFNIIEEQVEIINLSSQPLVIGDHNTFEVGVHIAGTGACIGNANVFECKARLGQKARIGDGCTLGIGVELPDGEQLADEIVVAGCQGLRHHEIGAKEAHIQAAMKHIEVLRETLPRCHHLRKPEKAPES